jgi:hypothetical protein
MIHSIPLTESQYIGLDKLCDERAAFDARHKRFLSACLVELGGSLREPWTFDEVTREFKIEIPDNPLTNANNDPTHAGSAAG